jgi:hypothetical protein
MKTKNFKLLILLLFLFGGQAQAERIVKKIYRSFPVNQVTKLELSNKYGNIQIDDNRKDSVIISVEIWVEGTSSRAQRVLDNINVNFSTSGTTVSAATDFRNDFNNFNSNFNIDYHVSVPTDRDLAVEQKYGTVNMNNLTGKGVFDIKYGEIRAKNLLSPSLSLDLAYSKASIEETKNMALTIKYSKISLNKGENLTIESRYSGLNIGDCKDVTLDSKYDDFRFTTINNLTVSSMYTGYKIDQILSSLVLTNGYGNFTVNTIPASFKSIKVSSRYATVRLGIANGASYKLDGTVRYCDLKHPAGKLNRSKEDTSYDVHGTVGESESPTSTVNIDSSYGNVTLIP